MLLLKIGKGAKEIKTGHKPSPVVTKADKG